VRFEPATGIQDGCCYSYTRLNIKNIKPQTQVNEPNHVSGTAAIISVEDGYG